MNNTMQKIRIVVDSGVDFPQSGIAERYQVAVVPSEIRFGEDERYQDYTEMNTERFFQRLSHDPPPPTLVAPTVEQFTQVYQNLSHYTDKIISLHTSRHLSDAWQNALTASHNLLGRCEIAVLDSQTTSAGLGLLVEFAVQMAETSTNLEEAVRILRGMVDRTYSIFYVDTLEYIQRSGLLGEAQAILGAMLGIKPFLTIEAGQLMTMEKVRTRSQAVDKLVEFVLEFNSVERIIILQSSPFTTEAVRLLQDRLASDFSRRLFSTISYGPTLASYLGQDATGLVVLEAEAQI